MGKKFGARLLTTIVKKEENDHEKFFNKRSRFGLKKFALEVKKYFIIKKWFFRSKKVKISRFFVETRDFGSKNRVFRC